MLPARLCALASFTLLLSAAELRAAAQPPDIEWRTLTTTHFQIHYNERNERSARRLAAMVEPIHDTLSRDYGWVPDETTHVVLVDYLDLTNGAATPLPYNTIWIYATPPSPNSALGDYDDWLRLVFTHEYVHILHLDQGSGPAKIVRDLLGRTAIGVVAGLPMPIAPFPNLFVPTWMIEGYATLDETRFTTGGRGHSAYSAMVLRMAYLDDRFFPLDKGSGPEGEWPGGAFRYLYGEAFLDYLSEKHGVEKVNAMFRANSYGLTPFLIDAPAFLAMNTLIEIEWTQWRKSIGEQATALKREIAGDELTELGFLTDGGWETRYPRLAADRKTVIYTVSNNYTYPHVKSLDLETGRSQTLFERNQHFGPAVPARDGRSIYFVQLETFKWFYLFGDAYRYDLDTGKKQRLTRGARLLSLDVSPDGKRVAAVQNDLQAQRLVLYRIGPAGLEPERVLAGGERRVLDTPRFSPDGGRVTYASWLPGGYADIFVTDLDGRTQRLTDDRHIDAAPQFTADGSAVIFSSDRSGIFNLYSLPAEATSSTEPRRLTNVIGGLFEADVVADDSVLAAAYRGDGFNVARVPLASFSATDTTLRPDRPAYRSAYSERFTGESRPYSPAETLWPRYWSPILNLAASPGGAPLTLEAGLATSGADVLRKHEYTAQVFYNRKLRRPGALTSYVYDGLWPTLTLSAETLPLEGAIQATRDGSEFEVPGIRADSLAATVALPFPKVRYSQQLSLGYVFTRDTEFGDLRHAGDPITRRRGAGIFRWTYDSSRYFGIGIGPQAGSLFGLTGRALIPALGADKSNALLLGDARRYISLPHRQVLTGQIQAGLAQRSEFLGPFLLGGTNPRLGLSDVGTLPLRGFLLGEQEGHKIAKGSAEYRFPLGLVKRGLPCWGTFPLLLDQLHGAIFVEGGSAWRDSPRWLASSGLELTSDFTLGYLVPVSLGLGVAMPIYGAPAEAGPTLYFVLSQAAF